MWAAMTMHVVSNSPTRGEEEVAPAPVRAPEVSILQWLEPSEQAMTTEIVIKVGSWKWLHYIRAVATPILEVSIAPVLSRHFSLFVRSSLIQSNLVFRSHA